MSSTDSGRRSARASARHEPKGNVPDQPVARARWVERHREIVDIAASVFAELGYHATTIDDLVEATGLKRGGLYHYIGGKRELLIHIHERFIAPLLQRADAIAALDDPPEVKLRLVAHALMEDIAEFRDQVTVFLHEWRVIESEPEWHEIRRSRRAFEEVIESILQDGIAQGAFDIDDVRVTVLAFLGMFNHSYQWFRPDGRISSSELADRFTDIFLRGIVPHQGDTSAGGSG